MNVQLRQIKGFGKGLYSTRGGNLSGLTPDGGVVAVASGVVQYPEVARESRS